jgi:DNA invertase Pin-like site-specific DNA recombinase
MTEWRAIPGYEGLYEVSDVAEVRRVSRGKKFSAEQVRAAKQMLAQNAKLKEVAAFLNTSITTVMAIKHGSTWVGDEAYRPVKIGYQKHYQVVRLCKDGKYRAVSVHRALWEAFVGPIEGRLEINHKNLDRSDNRLENLELVTHRENIQHAIDAYKAQGLLRAVKGVKGFVSGKHSKYDQ